MPATTEFGHLLSSTVAICLRVLVSQLYLGLSFICLQLTSDDTPTNLVLVYYTTNPVNRRELQSIELDNAGGWTLLEGRKAFVRRWLTTTD
jgi:hypothetical protein